MIGKDTFEEIIEIYKEYDEILNKFIELIPSIFDCSFVDKFWKCHHMLIRAYFTELGADYILDYLCNGNIEVNDVVIDDIDKLWDFIKEYRK